MHRQAIVSAAIISFSASLAEAQNTPDAQAWLIPQPATADSAPLRWRLSTETARRDGLVLDESDISNSDVSAIASQVDIYPFGDDFYLSAGTVAGLDPRRSAPAWTLSPDAPAWAQFPHTELYEDQGGNRLVELTRYLGAGITVRTIDSWSLTVEGGAYFQDRGQDRMMMFDPETGEEVPLLDDLDTVDREAVGEPQSRSVRSVGHLVLRRRF